jgi:DNA-binding CsgD family transcriptional regulator
MVNPLEWHRPAPRSPQREVVVGGAAGLTPRERDVLALLHQHLQDREIAGVLGIGVRTVEQHVANILAKLGAADRHQAVTLARHHGSR